MEPTRIDVRKLYERLRSRDHAAVLQSLVEVELGTALKLLTTYAGQGPDLDEWLSDVQLNQDSNMRLQYLAGMGLNLLQSDAILQKFLDHREYPANLFVVDPSDEFLFRRIFEPPTID